jgi:uncharacterized RDD family membrane protein YckC
VNVQALPRYAGLVTRAAAFVIDAAIVNGVALIFAGSVSLALTIFGSNIDDLSTPVKVVFGAGGWVALNLVYFVGSWTLTGQTAGMRVMSIRVEGAGGKRLSVLRAAIRVVGLVLAAIPLFAGYLAISSMTGAAACRTGSPARSLSSTTSARPHGEGSSDASWRTNGSGWPPRPATETEQSQPDRLM